MHPAILAAFTDELTKISTVPGPVKMYRRAVQALESGDRNFHGIRSEDLARKIEAGHMDPYWGIFGTGVYTWKKRPLSTYMTDAEQPGLIFKRNDLGGMPHPKDDPGKTYDRSTMALRPHMEVTEKRLTYPKKTTMLSATPEQLATHREALKRHKIRPMDAAIFNRAEADLRAENLYSPVYSPPGKKELIDLAKRKTRPPTFKMLRPKTDEDVDDFLDSYEAATSRSAARS